MRTSIYSLILIFLSACYQQDTTSEDPKVSPVEDVISEVAPKPVFRFPTEEEKAHELEVIEDHKKYLANLENTPWKTESRNIVLREGFESLSSESQREDLAIAKIALDRINQSGYAIDDNLRVLIEKNSQQAVVTFENPIQEGHLGGSYTYKVEIDRESGNVTSILLGV
ncbi:MAG: hypothetical protein R3F26_11575 [Gammaproteobacteria bacterium]